ncbi:acyltransferase family protein [Acinetobacter johnsonii]|uniref:acyltransferase family protein n=1 Tax=Acinetobacter johnsonii TaxID=40214 RepID=UPI00073D581F|nr:acyltransferase family protein [Acinetobacter johnsonii]ALV72599.1 acyltransferase [Acinetobacter johnsonii XBB1]
MSSNFRYDINGLRAYAVALVVLFHFGVFGFAGGFIGVDVFFVISGFLMTNIIVRGLENKTFNFLKFYLSRANRIIPALVALCAVIGLVGWFTLTQQELKDFAKHAITSLSFISNIQYFKEAGYFDATSHEKLLLHTWSLSVEWQFYILLPVFLYLVNKYLKYVNSLKLSYLFLLITSFILSVVISKINPSLAFYLLPTRAWEMMAGGLIYLFFSNLYLNKKISNIVEYIGFFLIFSSVFFFSSSTLWPSYNALIPVFGTFLILLSNNNSSTLTNNKLAQFLGKTSYSIYLWHWPIVFYLSYFEIQNNKIAIIFGISLSILFGWLSYKYIENKSRNILSTFSLKNGYIFTAIYILIPSFIFSFVIYKEGLPNRLSEETAIISKQADSKKNLTDGCIIASGVNVPECVKGDGRVSLIILGDSHGATIMNAAARSVPSNTSVLNWTYSGCPTTIGIKKLNMPNFKCSEVMQNFVKKQEKYKNTPILVVNRLNVLFSGALEDNSLVTPTRYINKPFNSYNDSYKSTMTNAYVYTICAFKNERDVYLLRPFPEFDKNVTTTMAHRSFYNSNERIVISRVEYEKRSKSSYAAQDLAVKKCGVKIIDATDLFCDKENCYADKKGIPLYFDTNHLSDYGANLLVPLIKKYLTN